MCFMLLNPYISLQCKKKKVTHFGASIVIQIAQSLGEKSVLSEVESEDGIEFCKTCQLAEFK